ncbi:MAG: hypothetical protein WCE61_14520 [Candidatus Acidiferrum sp.]
MDDQRKRYILLDRDGVISRRHSNGHAGSWEISEFLPRALEALRLLAANDYTGIVISRETCASAGTQEAGELGALTRRFLLEVAISEGHIAQVYYCRHRQEDGCDCYRPNAGLIARARADHGFLKEATYFISERMDKLESAAASGCPCIRIQRDAFLQAAAPSEGPYRVASNLYEAAEQILGLETARGRECAAIPS